MPFDLRPHVTEDMAEGQLNEGGAQSWENCTLSCLGATLSDYGYGDPLEPQDMRDLVAPGSTGGFGWQTSIDVVQRRPDLYGNPPDMTIEAPGDVPGAIDHYGQKGYMVHWAGWCLPNATWIDYQPANGISHAGRVLASDPAGFTIWNPVKGVEYLDNAFVAASYDGGGLLVFRRSLLPPPPTPPLGGTMFRPAGPSNRSDSAYLAGGHVWHMWRGGDSNASIEDRGTAPNGGRFVALINQGWDTASAAFNVEALSSDGQIYRAFWPFDPSQPAQDWTPITYNGGTPVKADVPVSGQGPKGDPGPAGSPGTTDPALAAEVAHLETQIKAIDNAIDGP